MPQVRTPEYNRSVPGVLKNAIDVASRPKESNAFNGKPGAVVSVSPGALSAFRALDRGNNRREDLVQKKNGASIDAPFFSGQLQPNQLQTIAPEELSQVFADCVCEAVALQVCGGPATTVAVTVTFCEGVKPCALPLPEKYAPLLSAAYCSS